MSGDTGHVSAEELARQVRLLRLRALKPVRSHLAGAYASAFHGPGMTFQELRHYEPGDDVRLMDWHVLARFGEPFVRRFAEERELRVLVAADVSGSMDYPASGASKRRTACEAAAALALSAVRRGDRVGGVLFGGRSIRTVEPRRGERHALHLLRLALSERAAGPATDPREALRALTNLHGHAVAFVLSDMQFDPPLGHPEVRRLLGRVARRHELVAVSIWHPAEIDPGSGAILECRDAEAGGLARLDLYAQDGRRQGDGLASRVRDIEAAFAAAGADCVWLRAGEDCHLPLRRLFRLRERRRAGTPRLT